MPSAQPSSPAPSAGELPSRAFAHPRAGAWFLAAFVLVLAGSGVHAFGLDRTWMMAVHAHAAGAVAATFWSCLTVAGLGWSALVILLAADRRSGALAATIVPSLVIGGLLAHVPKHLIAEPRPAATDIAPQLHVIGHAFTGAVSMPSGHALAAGAGAALLCTLAARTPVARVLIVVVAVLIAVSRVVVGAHWPGDVLVGAGLGLLAAAIVLALAAGRRTGAWYRWLAPRLRTCAGQRWIAAVELGVAAGLLSENTGYPAGVPMVWLLVAVAVISAGLRLVASRHAGEPVEAQDARAGLP
ncbi:phosphatase PAP2 family protein [Ramlibacter ginsenosidimutans]|uniref:Phosphatase PAP2 family protein n=1 Tax=Ramlibacter ginsenosidimutans TaxID=502333 RepID=A0A934TW39_9BURK|nr:phosphatase PAP2 family protein [Ramlibacter ginsenosidimutans]MBK6007792.1 phosphatase PAP2 family protein [Ramlibacter ginsenosidimutans]